MCSRFRRRAARCWAQRLLALTLAGVALAIAPAYAAQPRALRVCADPNNLPFSNEQGEGLENRLAQIVAADLKATLEYTWWAQRRGFFRNTLREGRCDVVIGVPASFELAATTRPYYRSTYVFVERRTSGLQISSLDDPRLRELKIGVQMIGDDGANAPPVHALNNRGIVDNLRNFKSDPELIRGSLLPVRPIAKQRALVIERGKAAVLDLFLANDTQRPATGTLTLTMITPSGRRRTLITLPAPQQQADVFSYLLKEGFETPALEEEGLYRFKFAISSAPLPIQLRTSSGVISTWHCMPRCLPSAASFRRGSSPTAATPMRPRAIAWPCFAAPRPPTSGFNRASSLSCAPPPPRSTRASSSPERASIR